MDYQYKYNIGDRVIRIDSRDNFNDWSAIGEKGTITKLLDYNYSIIERTNFEVELLYEIKWDNPNAFSRRSFDEEDGLSYINEISISLVEEMGGLGYLYDNERNINI